MFLLLSGFWWRHGLGCGCYADGLGHDVVVRYRVRTGGGAAVKYKVKDRSLCKPGYRCLVCPYSKCVCRHDDFRRMTEEEKIMLIHSGMFDVWSMRKARLT